MKPNFSHRILVIGRNGQVGWELRRTLAPLGQLVAIDYPEIDLTSADSIRKWIRDVAPTVVVNAAAYTAVDKAETETELAMKINGIAPGVLAEESKRAGALLIHYSTDYVFDGTKGQPYVEDDPPNPLGAYGRTKLAGDRAIQAVDGDQLIFRLCWVYGTRGQNFLLTMMRLARERETLRVVNDQVGAPTWSRLIAEVTALVLKKVMPPGAARALRGVYHLSAGGSTSWHGFAEAIVGAMPSEARKCRAVQAITTAEYPTPARRPAYSVMSGEKLKQTFGLALPDWREGLQLALDQTL